MRHDAIRHVELSLYASLDGPNNYLTLVILHFLVRVMFRRLWNFS